MVNATRTRLQQRIFLSVLTVKYYFQSLLKTISEGLTEAFQITSTDIWYGILGIQILDPFFFREYLHDHFFQKMLIWRYVKICGINKMEHLDETFPNTWTGRFYSSCTLEKLSYGPLRFFLWDTVKGKVYITQLNNNTERLEQKIYN